MYDELAAHADNPEQLFDRLARQLVAEDKLHELFDARLMQSRWRLGIPLQSSRALEEIEEPLRSEVEQCYLAACREVGRLLLESGKCREGWMYLRATGDTSLMRDWFERALPDDDRIEEMIEVALHEGVDVERGFGWLLGRYGTCNSISTLEGLIGKLDNENQQACVATLVRHLHGELSANVRAHLERQQETAPAGASLADMVASHPWLLEDDAYHIDMSHLASTVRLARLLVEPAAVALARDLAAYGRGLGASLQFAGDPPFEDLYPSHQLFFAATLGDDVENALRYFRERAAAIAPDEHGTAALETYLILLTRCDRHGEALAAFAQLVPDDVTLSPFAPSPLTLAEQSANWQLYDTVMRRRGDVIGFVAGQLAARRGAQRPVV